MSTDLESMLAIPLWPLGPAFHRLCRTSLNLDPKLASALDAAEAYYARPQLKHLETSLIGPSSVANPPPSSDLILDLHTRERLASSTMLSNLPETPGLEKSVYHSTDLKPSQLQSSVCSAHSKYARKGLETDENSDAGALHCCNTDTVITAMEARKPRRLLASDLFEEQLSKNQQCEKSKIPAEFSFQSVWNHSSQAESTEDGLVEENEATRFSFQSSWNHTSPAVSSKVDRVDEDLAFPKCKDFSEDRHNHQPSTAAAGKTMKRVNSDRLLGSECKKIRYSCTESQAYPKFSFEGRERTTSMPDTRDSRRSSFETTISSPKRGARPDQASDQAKVSHPPYRRESTRHNRDHVGQQYSRREFGYRIAKPYYSSPESSGRRTSGKDCASRSGQDLPLSPIPPQNTPPGSQPSILHSNTSVTVNEDTPNVAENNFPLDRKFMHAICRHVRLSTDRYIVEAFCRIGMWLERKGVWKQDNWGTLSAADLARFLDIGGPSRLEETLRRNFPSSFEEILSGASKRKVVELDLTGNQMDVRLNKDFTPRGLFYRPLIRGLRTHYFLEKKEEVEVSYLERNYLLKKASNSKLSDVLPPGFSTHTYVQWAHGERVVHTSRDPKMKKFLLVRLSPEWFRASSCVKNTQVSKLNQTLIIQIERLMTEKPGFTEKSSSSSGEEGKKSKAIEHQGSSNKP